jgi:bla regulator protein blaR1
MTGIADHVLQSSVCAGLAALLALTLSRAPATTRHTIWLLASLKFLLPLSFLVAVGQYIARIASAQAGEVSIAIRWLDRSWLAWGAPLASARSILPDAGAWFWTMALTAAWAAGAAIVAQRRWRDWTRVRTVVHGATPLVTGREVQLLRRVAASLPIERWRRAAARLHIVLASSQVEPGVFGIGAPVLLWPQHLSEQLTDAELQAVLTHELCHVERRDNLTALAQTTVEILFWFNPVVWWLGSRLVSEREKACDEEVVTMGNDERSYAEAILKVCGFCLQPSSAFVAGVRSADLSQRIIRIMTPARCWPPRWLARVSVAAATACVLGVPLAAGVAEPRRGAISSQAGAAGQTAGTTREVFKGGKGTDVTLPKLVKESKPIYTRAAMSAKVQGSVTVEAVVEADGRVTEVKVVKSLDKEHGLDDEAVSTIKKWVFTPGTKDGAPVAVRIEVEMTFTLK